MKSSAKLLVFILAALFIVSCASSGNRGLTLYGETRVIDGEYDRVFNVTRDYISELGFPIMRANLEKGQIMSDYKEGARLTNMGSAGTKEFRAKFRARMERVSDTQTRLTLEYFPEEKDLHTGWELIEIDMNMARATYNRYFEQINARLQGRTIK